MTKDNDCKLPVIPLSPIVQSYIISTNALNLATEKLTEAKKLALPVDTWLETQKVESHRLKSLNQKMQSVEAATALYWDSDSLARQIAVINSQLFNKAQLQDTQPNLVHLVDFNNYLTHSFAHQLVYWAELLKKKFTVVVPAVNPSKDSLVTHLVRVAYLLLHAYRDFSGFSAIMRALALPQVKRLEKKLWQNCASRTKDVFKDLVKIISPENNYHAYQTSIRTKIDMHRQQVGMIAVPWIQPHILSIRSMIEEANPGLDMEIAFLELCQQGSFAGEFSVQNVLTANGMYETTVYKRASTKAIHIDGLRSAVIPAANLTHLAPGEQLVHHWLVSRVYLTYDQLTQESVLVDPLKPGEIIPSEPKEDFCIPQFDTEINTKQQTNTNKDEEPANIIDSEDTTKEEEKPDTNKEKDTKKLTITISNKSTISTKSRLSPSAPEFIPRKHSIASSSTDSEQWLGYPIPDTDSEQWFGYPVPSSSEEWKGYHATKMWQRETALQCL